MIINVLIPQHTIADRKFTTLFLIFNKLSRKIIDKFYTRELLLYLQTEMFMTMPLALFGFLHITLADVLDILVVSLIIFFVFRWIRGSSAMNIFIALIILYLIKVLASALDMTMMSGIMGTVLDVGVIAIIIIFQPEIRYFLTRMGSRYGVGGGIWRIFDRLFGRSQGSLGNEEIAEIVEAVFTMSESKTGALIVMVRKDSLQNIIDTGDTIDARINSRLLCNLFFKNSPLHDGAVVINGNRIVAARCTLPLTGKTGIPASYGMRHKAAIGMTELSDACVVVVSEETGGISFAAEGEIIHVFSKNHLRQLLGEEAAPAKQGGEQI